MPNYVKCRVSCDDMELVRMLYSTKMDDGQDRFDFERIIPMPDWVRETTRTDVETDSPCDWYRWSIEHWGVKWNAIGTVWTEEYVEFETAWDAPWRALGEMAWQLSRDVYLDYADESIGCNCAHVVIHPNGEYDSYVMNEDESAQMWGYEGYKHYMDILEQMD